jgi:arylformamidase
MSSGDWIDISVPLRNGMVAWPGDTPFERSNTLEIANGDPCNLSQISTTAHIGTHMDAPRHYLRDGAGMETMPIAASIGRCRVIEIHDAEAIRTSELEPLHLARAGAGCSRPGIPGAAGRPISSRRSIFPSLRKRRATWRSAAF